MQRLCWCGVLSCAVLALRTHSSTNHVLIVSLSCSCTPTPFAHTQAFFKEAYKARVRKQQSESGDDGRGRGGRTAGRTEAWLENLCQVGMVMAMYIVHYCLVQG